jgi:hypothetical protein
MHRPSLLRLTTAMMIGALAGMSPSDHVVESTRDRSPDPGPEPAPSDPYGYRSRGHGRGASLAPTRVRNSRAGRARAMQKGKRGKR